MRYIQRRLTAAFFLMAMVSELVVPVTAYALTSGPAQPEMAKFAPAGNTDMVDLFTGDMKYNIPLMDVGGYPVNLSYGSGAGMEDEASWVGSGWTLNPGAINRQVRGLPDDFDGSKGDSIYKTNNRKEFHKVGGTLSGKLSAFGFERGSGKLSVNVYKDNYYGIGASVSAGMNLSLSLNQATSLTASLDISSDVRTGVNISPSMSISQLIEDRSQTLSGSMGLSGSLLYNSRDGLKTATMGLSFRPNIDPVPVIEGEEPSATYSKSVYFGQSYTPSLTSNTSNSGYILSYSGGIVAGPLYIGVGITGMYYQERLLTPKTSVAAFGYLNHVKGRKNLNALLDFNREKDGVFLPSAPIIPIPVATEDVYTATSQEGSLQFRPVFNGNYTTYDPQYSNTDKNTSFGVDGGAGWGLMTGINYNKTSGGSKSNKWVTNNQYLVNAEASFNSITPTEEAISFNVVGEKVRHDQNEDFFSNIGHQVTNRVNIGNGVAYSQLIGNNGILNVTQPLKKNARNRRTRGISYLNAINASKYAIDKTIEGQPRVNQYRKKHHISEYTITENDGTRKVYGIPVYNIVQKEATFAVAAPSISQSVSIRQKGLLTYSSNNTSPQLNKFGRSNQVSIQTIPPYTTGHLLSAILSPDYVDKTGNGVSDDDLGTATKFNYTMRSSDYQWRSPYQAWQANYNEGFLSDPKDDNASYVYGQKELWFLSSIETKTMIAFFKTSPRKDGLGVASENGGASTSQTLLKLDSIVLYSKPDWAQNGNAAIPVKVVHFEYDYSLFRGIPNNVDFVTGGGLPSDLSQGGKLTLKKLYFTFGQSARGTTNPYEFGYDTRLINRDGIFPMNQDPLEGQDLYTQRQSDRWGAYKQSFYNRIINGQPVLNNSEFPFVPQENENTPYSEREMADRLVSKWQLNRITTPTGSIISVEYESDDYAYVQNKKAMQMCFIKGFGNVQSPAPNLLNADRIVIELPQAVSSAQGFRDLYLRKEDGTYQDKIFYKISDDIDHRGHYEFVNGYASINNAVSGIQVSSDGRSVSLQLIKINGYNPIAVNCWQLLRTSLPQYAYDGYDNSDVGGDVKTAIFAIVRSIGNLSELVKSFESKATGKKFGDVVDVQKSMVRLYNPTGIKIGGGARVKKVTVSDEWNIMTNGKTAQYGQLYSYHLTENGKDISSGVASYEPQIGNEENPFHEPVEFTEKVFWGSDRYHYIEKPFCETFFPGPQVGYSQVTVTPFGDDYAGGEGLVKYTGETVNGFYTAKDFPTIVDYLPLTQRSYENSLTLKLFSSISSRKMTTSQGFRVEVNDMHGKIRYARIFNKGRDLVSSTEYFYKTKFGNAKELDNNVDVLKGDGVIMNTEIATDMDFTTDFRESNVSDRGGYRGANGGYFPAFIFPIFYFMANLSQSTNDNLYRSVSTVKVIHRYGLLQKVTNVQNGSSISTENLMWDGETGDVLLTKTQTEFGTYTYAFTYPAYMAYEGMAGAYKNIGAIVQAPGASDGNINVYSSYLFPGDELADTSGYRRAWVIKAGDNQLHLIDSSGRYVSSAGSFQVLRSGRRNMFSSTAGTVLTMEDPRVNGYINLGQAQKILDSKAVIYKNEWGIPVNGDTTSCGVGFTPSPDGSYCYKDTVPIISGDIYNVCNLAQYGAYSSCGTAIYSDFASNLTFFSRTFVPQSNAFWSAHESDKQDYCDYSPPENLYPTSDQSRKSSLTAVDSTKLKAAKNSIPQEPLGGPLNRCGVWVCPNSSFEPTNKWIGFTKFIQVPPSAEGTKTYYIGIAADNNFKLRVDGNIIVSPSENNKGENFKIWHIFPVTISSGPHIFEFSGLNVNDRAAFGAEIYDNTASELMSASRIEDLNIVYSTTWEVNSTFAVGTYACPINYHLFTEQNPYTCRSFYISNTGCPNPGAVLNPYTRGVLGNWRPWVSYVYHVNRVLNGGSDPGSTNIATSGYYDSYSPFWAFSSNGLMPALQAGGIDPMDNKWVWTNQSIYFDQKGNGVEDVDALFRYSAALYGYANSLMTANASNSRLNEMAFDSFEDYDYNSTESCPLPPHFLELGYETSAGYITSQYAHTGKYSLRLTRQMDLTRGAGSASPVLPILGYNTNGTYRLVNNEQAYGFAPVPGKKYVLGFWVNDHVPASDKVNGLSVSINGISYPLATTKVPVVEGWKRVELEFTAGENFHLALSPSFAVELDDIRVAPYDASMVSYVYDQISLKLRAQLDENNYATFYEYDEEGTPVRVKKETERGVMTIKESRQGFRQHP